MCKKLLLLLIYYCCAAAELKVKDGDVCLLLWQGVCVNLLREMRNIEEYVKFVELHPCVPSYALMFMLEAMTYKVVLSVAKSIDIRRLVVQAWTSQCDSQSADGSWHAVDLPYIGNDDTHDIDTLHSADDMVTHVYGQSVIITSDRDFEFTFRVNCCRESNELDCCCGGDDAETSVMVPRDDQHVVWASGFAVNGFVHVEPPRLHDRWTLGPDYDHIIGRVHVGNFIAATHAADLGFTHVLNVADNLDMVYAPLSVLSANQSSPGSQHSSNEHSAVTYHKVSMRDGAHNPIDPNLVYEAVDWLRSVDQPHSKVLVNCRAGIGRAGSVGVAYVFATNPTMTFNEAYDYVFARRFVYPHAGLAAALYQLFPRQF